MSDKDRLWAIFAVAVAFVLGMYAGAEGATGKPADVVIPTVIGVAVLVYIGIRGLGLASEVVEWMRRRRG